MDAIRLALANDDAAALSAELKKVSHDHFAITSPAVMIVAIILDKVDVMKQAIDRLGPLSGSWACILVAQMLIVTPDDPRIPAMQLWCTQPADIMRVVDHAIRENSATHLYHVLMASSPELISAVIAVVAKANKIGLLRTAINQIQDRSLRQTYTALLDHPN